MKWKPLNTFDEFLPVFEREDGKMRIIVDYCHFGKRYEIYVLAYGKLLHPAEKYDEDWNIIRSEYRRNRDDMLKRVDELKKRFKDYEVRGERKIDKHKFWY